MALKEVSFPSYNGRDIVKGWIYTPITKPKAIVQIVHGLGEHSRRYLHLIVRLTEAGFVVCADDHVGHGKTALDSETWGDLGNKGYMTTIEDERSLYNIVKDDFPNLPHIMFGHSWGSIIARVYAAHYGSELSGLAICGAPAVFKNFLDLREKTSPYIQQGRDNEVVEEFIIKGFSNFTERYENVKTPNDWIASDENVVADHASDSLNNFAAFNVRLLHDLSEAVWAVQGAEWASKIPSQLPVYNIAGDMDPVGGYGEGTYMITRWLYEAGRKNVKTRLYSGYRHEIHNEPAIKNEVEEGIIQFAESCI